MSKITRLVMAGVVAGGVLLAPAVAWADGPQNCNNNSIMYCGAYSKGEFEHKLRHGDGRNEPQNLHQIFFNEGRGFTMDDFMSNDTVDGVVTKDGRVMVTGSIVATDAWSTGRTPNPQANRSGSVWLSPNAAEFRSERLDAWVNMKDGVFQWAIIKACGNTVVAKPAFRPAPTPAPTPTPRPVIYRIKTHHPTPTPMPVPVATPVPAPTPTPVIPKSAFAAPKPLPVTGPEAALAGIGGIGAIGYATRSYVKSRKSLLDHLRKTDK